MFILSTCLLSLGLHHCYCLTFMYNMNNKLSFLAISKQNLSCLYYLLLHLIFILKTSLRQSTVFTRGFQLHANIALIYEWMSASLHRPISTREYTYHCYEIIKYMNFAFQRSRCLIPTMVRMRILANLKRAVVGIVQCLLSNMCFLKMCLILRIWYSCLINKLAVLAIL